VRGILPLQLRDTFGPEDASPYRPRVRFIYRWGGMIVMAKRRKRTAARTTTKIVRVGSPAPIVRVSAPRAVRRRRRGGRRRSGGGNIAGGLVSNESVQLAIGGALYGFAVKQGWIEKLPALPIVGRTGAAALILDYFGRRGGGEMVRRAGKAAAVIAGYQLGTEGKILGDDMEGDADTYIAEDAYGG
jgi:hypothetical protein